MIQFSNNQKAFVLLYAVLVSSIVLSIGLSLINLFTKQVILSSIGRSSQFAYYAADAGKQCAYYWYASLYPVFGAGEDGRIYMPPEVSSGRYIPPELKVPVNGEPRVSLFCYKTDIVPIPITYFRPDGVGDSQLESRFEFDLAVGEDTNKVSCAKVVVNRGLFGVGDDIQIETTIRSSGYNASCAEVNGNVNNPRRIERVVYRVDRVSPGQ